MSSVTTVHPATGEAIETYPNWTGERLDQQLQNSSEAQREWEQTAMADRSERLTALAASLRRRQGDLASLAAREMGKCVAEGRAEVEKCAWVCEYYAEQGANHLAPDPRPSDANVSRVIYQPLGTILGIMPWNFPYWQVLRFAAPTLMAGNACLIKHAPNVRGCAEALDDVFLDAGLPKHSCRQLPIDLDRVPDLIADRRVHGVSLTGSTEAGRAVASLAGQSLKPCLLELGGSDPYLVLEDADPERAAEICVTSRMINNGQSCIAAKRFIVHASIRPAFEEACRARLADYIMGDPEDLSTRLGPLARDDLRMTLHDQVTRSIAAGAACTLGGALPDGRGFYYPPTLLTDPPPGSPARTEELFGPAACLIEVEDEQEAVRVANETPYGLGACVITADADRGQKIAEEKLRAGACFVNGFVKSDPRLPFGGIQDSGFGRELGREGIRAFTNHKLISVE